MAAAPSPAMAMIIGQAKDPDHVVAPIAHAAHGLGEDDLTLLMRRIQEAAAVDARLLASSNPTAAAPKMEPGKVHPPK